VRLVWIRGIVHFLDEKALRTKLLKPNSQIHRVSSAARFGQDEKKMFRFHLRQKEREGRKPGVFANPPVML
jgi:hypothetical protein